MAKRGRPPKSREERLANGNAGKRKLPPPAEPAALASPEPSDPLAPPAYLGKEAKLQWSVVVQHLAKRGLMIEAYTPALVAYCQAVESMIECGKVIEKEGRHYTTPTGQIKRRPEVEMQASAWTTVRLFSAEFGLTSLQGPRLDHALASVGRQGTLFGDKPVPPAAAPEATAPQEAKPASNDPVARFAIH